MQDKKIQFSNTLMRFAPEPFVPYLTELILKSKAKFKIVPGRATKLGDFRIMPGEDKPIITVNGDLNKFSFLITTLHELAHLNTWRMYGNRVHQAVFEAGVQETGITIHFVNEGFDEGAKIAQFYVSINASDTPETIKNKVQHLEHTYFPLVCAEIIKGLDV